ncbi:MAG: hypothetical protein V9G10_16650 [Candidatus Nanopelagicales bacterium]
MIPFAPPADAPKPPVVEKFIPYGNARKRQMAGYSYRHYGVRTWQLNDPQAIVLALHGEPELAVALEPVCQ